MRSEVMVIMAFLVILLPMAAQPHTVTEGGSISNDQLVNPEFPLESARSSEQKGYAGYFLFGSFIVLLIWFFLRVESLKIQPSFLGDPFFEVIYPNEPIKILERAEQIAFEHYGRRRAKGRIPPVPELPMLIDPIEHGSLTGWGWIERPTGGISIIPLCFDHLPSYRASIRYPDGWHEVIVFLQRGGGVIHPRKCYFIRFTPIRITGIAPRSHDSDQANKVAQI